MDEVLLSLEPELQIIRAALVALQGKLMAIESRRPRLSDRRRVKVQADRLEVSSQVGPKPIRSRSGESILRYAHHADDKRAAPRRLN
jgi:hypothetical protein